MQTADAAPTRRGPRAGAPLLALAAGGLQALSLAWPGAGQAVWWLQVLSLAILVALLQPRRGPLALGVAVDAGSWPTPPNAAPDSRPRPAWHAAGLGWLFATAWLSGSFWWLFISMHTYGGLAAPLAVAAVLALAGALAGYYALAAAVFLRIFSRYPSAKWSYRAIVFASLWTLAELARGRLFTGFPWGAGGYAHVDGPLAGYAPWLGVYGVGALASALAVAVVALMRGPARVRTGAAVAAAALVLLPLANPGFSTQAGRFSVALLQGNISQGEKFQPSTGIADALRWYGERLRDEPASLVVAPETALPMLPQQLPEGYLDDLRARFASGRRAALVGIPLGSYEAGYTNSALGLAPGQAAPYRYDKHHLVPFGEFVPPLFRWFVELMHIPLGDFSRGPLAAPNFDWDGQRLAPNICYEDLFGEELGARFADTATAPTAMVNLSNIAWFGDTVAVAQHLNISRMRSLEFERPMLRATNTGATAVIDHRGRVSAALPPFERAVLRAEVEGRAGLTPYARWVPRLGLWPLALLAAAVVALAVRGASRQRTPGPVRGRP